MLKEGYRHYSGPEEGMVRSIEAVDEISNICQTSYGPRCMKKMVVNHIDKLYVTSDINTIFK